MTTVQQPDRPAWRALHLKHQVTIGDVARWDVPPLDRVSIVAVTQGACHIGSRHATGWRSAAYIAGDIGITLPGRPLVLRWELLADSPFETVHIHLPVATFERYMLEEPHISSTDLESLDVLSTPDPVVTAMAKSVVEAHRLGAGELHAEYAAQYLVAHLLAPRATHAPERGVLSPKQLDVVVEYMRAHLGSRITLEDLAAEIALSRFHFVRRFSATTGYSPIQFLTDLRIESARRQLEVSDEPVSLIGRRVGFGSASHFTASFTRHVGCSPTTYRRHRRLS